MGRFGDGIGTGSDLGAAALSALTAAVAPLGGRAPDLVQVFVGGGDPDEMAGVALACGERSGSQAVLGCTAAGVMGGGRSCEGATAVGVFAAVLPGARLRTFHLEVMPVDAGAAVVGMPELRPSTDEVALLFADAYSFPAGSFADRTSDSLPGMPVVGGVADGPRGAGSTRLWVDGRVVDRGAVGVLLDGASARPLVSQGCRPVGPAMTVTAARGNLLLSLAGRPAVAALRDLLADLPPTDQALVSGGLLLGIAVDEYADERTFLVRSVLGTDPAIGGLLVSDLVPVGTTVQLQVRDADAADADLRAALERCPGQPGSGALVFSGAERGSGLFGASYGGAEHDQRTVRSVLAADAVGGFFTSGQLGPVAGRNRLHSLAASLLVLP